MTVVTKQRQQVLPFNPQLGLMLPLTLCSTDHFLAVKWRWVDVTTMMRLMMCKSVLIGGALYVELAQHVFSSDLG